MENKSALESAIEEIVMHTEMASQGEGLPPNLTDVLNILERTKEKDKEQRKALVIETRKESIFNHLCLIGNPCTKEDLNVLEERAQQEAEQYYKQKHESNEST